MGRNINPAPGSRKTVQRGTIILSGISQTATIAAIDATKGDLRLLGYRSNSSATGLGAFDSPTLELTDGTTITARRVSSSSGISVIVNWELTIFN